MGYLKERYNMDLMLPKPAPGACPECGREHAPEEPHDRESLVYQYGFYDKNGRFPTWRDALSHCDPVVISTWQKILTEYGVDVDH